MTKGEVCPNEGKIGRNRLVKATRRPETRLIERKTGSWFQNGACSATIGAEFGSYLGNVGFHDWAAMISERPHGGP